MAPTALSYGGFEVHTYLSDPAKMLDSVSSTTLDICPATILGKIKSTINSTYPSTEVHVYVANVTDESSIAKTFAQIH
jgi:hypothetical protein